jgi:hypothetical protein
MGYGLRGQASGFHFAGSSEKNIGLKRENYTRHVPGFWIQMHAEMDYDEVQFVYATIS